MINNTTEKELLDELYDREGRFVNAKPAKKAKPQKKLTDYPDAKKHQLVSFIKSIIRILGYTLIPFDLIWAASVLVVSEFVGIIEELV
tara:strand:+ start:229 stop:492 length:264 start_codon:yes stop_codon:yes gene_type:complete